jgi:ABC-type Na+ transport system ATPase subunit NatA
MTETTNLVEVRDLTKRYGRTLAIDGISLDIAKGERYAILGPNGAGKTTLIHVLCTIHRADSGTAVVDGFEVHKQPRLARRRIGVVFQEPSVDTRLTVEENLEFHGRVYGVPGKLRRQRIKELLELVELSDWRGHLVRALSKGMQRRLEIARALVHDAALLILDEPTVGLDAQTRGRMWTYLADLQRGASSRCWSRPTTSKRSTAATACVWSTTGRSSRSARRTSSRRRTARGGSGSSRPTPRPTRPSRPRTRTRRGTARTCSCRSRARLRSNRSWRPSVAGCARSPWSARRSRACSSTSPGAR